MNGMSSPVIAALDICTGILKLAVSTLLVNENGEDIRRREKISSTCDDPPPGPAPPSL